MRASHILTACALLSILGHGVVVIGLPRSPQPHPELQTPATQTQPHSTLTLRALTHPLTETRAISPSVAALSNWQPQAHQHPSPTSVANLAQLPVSSDSAASAVPATQALSTYLDSKQLAYPPFPKSAPELERLETLAVTGLPIHLRLYINSQGEVVHIDVLQASPDDAEAIEQIKSLFYETAFIPAQSQGIALAAYKDIEIGLNLTPPPPEPDLPLTPRPTPF